MNLYLAYLLWLLMVVDNSSFTSRVTFFFYNYFYYWDMCGKFPSFVNCYQYYDFKLTFLPLSFYDSLFVHSNPDEVSISLYLYIFLVYRGIRVVLIQLLGILEVHF